MTYNISKFFNKYGSIGKNVNNFASFIELHNGKVYVVGGMVRDFFMQNFTNKLDLDLCITGIPYDELERLILTYDPSTQIDHVGKSFGILNIANAPFGTPTQISIPRSDKDRDIVTVDHTLPIEHDLNRRDFTINALAVKVGKQLEVIGDLDHITHIKNKFLCAVGNPDDRFNEDPLRILRGLQFISRFELKIDPKTEKSIFDNIHLLKKLSIDRLEAEFTKGCKTKKSYDVFAMNLQKFGIGELLFGKDFNPIISNSSYIVAYDKFWHAYMFLNGGDYTQLTPKRDYKLIIETVRSIKKYLDTKSKAALLPMLSACRRFPSSHFSALQMFFISCNESYGDAFAQPLIPNSDFCQRMWYFPVTGKNLEIAFTAMNREVPYRDFNYIMVDLLWDAQQGAIQFNELSTQSLLNKYLIEKSYK